MFNKLDNDSLHEEIGIYSLINWTWHHYFLELEGNLENFVRNFFSRKLFFDKNFLGIFIWRKRFSRTFVRNRFRKVFFKKNFKKSFSKRFFREIFQDLKFLNIMEMYIIFIPFHYLTVSLRPRPEKQHSECWVAGHGPQASLCGTIYH